MNRTDHQRAVHRAEARRRAARLKSFGLTTDGTRRIYRAKVIVTGAFPDSILRLTVKGPRRLQLAECCGSRYRRWNLQAERNCDHCGKSLKWQTSAGRKASYDAYYQRKRNRNIQAGLTAQGKVRVKRPATENEILWRQIRAEMAVKSPELLSFAERSEL